MDTIHLRKHYIWPEDRNFSSYGDRVVSRYSKSTTPSKIISRNYRDKATQTTCHEDNTSISAPLKIRQFHRSNPHAPPKWTFGFVRAQEVPLNHLDEPKPQLAPQEFPNPSTHPAPSNQHASWPPERLSAFIRAHESPDHLDDDLPAQPEPQPTPQESPKLSTHPTPSKPRRPTKPAVAVPAETTLATTATPPGTLWPSTVKFKQRLANRLSRRRRRRLSYTHTMGSASPHQTA